MGIGIEVQCRTKAPDWFSKHRRNLWHDKIHLAGGLGHDTWIASNFGLQAPIVRASHR